MIRAAILFAISPAYGACSPEKRGGNSAAAGEANVAVAPLGKIAHGRGGQGMTFTSSETRIVIASDRGRVTAKLTDNAATKALVRMLPLTIEMRDHLRQEKTATLPAPLPNFQRQAEFSVGTLGLWGAEDFVIYYRPGRVPQPGIIVLGHVTGDLSIFEGPDPVTVRLELAE